MKRLICALIGHDWHEYGLGSTWINYRECDRCNVEQHYNAGRWESPAGGER